MKVRLARNFFQKRVQSKRGRPLKAFANETLSCIVVLTFFAECVLRPRGKLIDNCDALGKLKLVVDFTLSEDLVLPLINEFEAAIDAHNRDMSRIYPDDMRGRKHHYMLHLPQCVRKVGRTLSCFAPERRHKIGKSRGRFTYRNVAHSILRYDLRGVLQKMAHPHAFCESFLCSPVRRVHGLEASFALHGASTGGFSSKSISTRAGTFTNLRLCGWRRGAEASTRVGKPHLFLRVTFIDKPDIFLAIVEEYVGRGDQLFDTSSTMMVVVPASWLKTSPSSILLDNAIIRVVQPLVF